MEPEHAALLGDLTAVLEARNAQETMLVKALEEAPEPPDHSRMAEQSRQWIAKAEAEQHDHALAALGGREMSGAAVLAKSGAPGDLAALARLARSVELRERIASQAPADNRGRLSWQVNPTTATVDETVRMVEQLAAAGS